MSQTASDETARVRPAVPGRRQLVLRRYGKTGIDDMPLAARAAAETGYRWRQLGYESAEIFRRFKRRFWPGAPTTSAIVAIGLTVAAVPFACTYVLGLTWWSWSEGKCQAHALGCALSSHVLGTALVAALAYYLVFLRQEARMAASWTKTVRREPEQLFADYLSDPEGLSGTAAMAGLTRRPLRRRARGTPRLPPIASQAVPRLKFVKTVLDDLNQTTEPQVIIGPTGSGKTTTLMMIARALSRQGQVAVPLSMRGIAAEDLGSAAREAFVGIVMRSATANRSAFKRARASDRDQADKWWNWLRRRQLITVLVDNFDKSLKPSERRRALEVAREERLRVIVATREDGLPVGFGRGRRELDPLAQSDVEESLLRLAGISSGVAEQLSASDHLRATPYYLAVARVLAAIRELPHITDEDDIRVTLLDRYYDCVWGGRLMSQAGIHWTTRASVLARLQIIAYVRILGIKQVEKLARQVQKLEGQLRIPADERSLGINEAVDLGRRLTILDTRSDGKVNFDHPTTLAYFASRFLRAHWPLHDPVSWRRAFANRGPLTSEMRSCLVLASASGGQPELAAFSCDLLLGGLEDDAEPTDELRAYDRLALTASAAEILRRPANRSAALSARVAAAARRLTVSRSMPMHQTQRLINALANIGDYETIWEFANERHEYQLRRAAMRVIVAERDADPVVIPRMQAAVLAAVREAEANPCHDDDHLPVIDAVKTVAFMLPTLCHAKDLGSERTELLKRLQGQLTALALGHQLTTQRGLEASLAQGLKMDALLNPSDDNEFIEPMLRNARFWFSRILLLQAATRRCISGKRSREFHLDVERTAALRPLIDQAAVTDRHAFVRHAARLCRRALDSPRDWPRFIWTDTAEVVTRHPEELDVSAVQLLGDIVVALNLNGHQAKEFREAFGLTDRLPPCLSDGRNRRVLMGYQPPPEACPLRQAPAPSDESGRPQAGCHCPYVYHSGDLSIDTRRELSRVFCRHLRLTARPVPWQPDLEVGELQAFWDHMERLARF